MTRTRPRSSKRRAPKSPPRPPPTATVGEKISDVATLSGPHQPRRRRRSQLRPLQGRRLLGRQRSSKPSARPITRSPPTANTPPTLRHHRHRRRHLPLDRPLLRRRQQQTRSTAPASTRTRPRSVEKASPEIATEATATATVGADDLRRRHPLRAGQPRAAPATVSFDLYKGADCSAPNKVGATLGRDRQPGRSQRHFHRRRRRHHHHRRRRLPLDRPLLRRRQQRSRQRRLPRREREHDRRKDDPRPRHPGQGRHGHRRRLDLRRRHPLGPRRPQRRHGHFRPLQGHRLLGPQQGRRHPERDR